MITGRNCFLKVYCNPEVLFKRHVLAFFEKSDSKEVRIFFLSPKYIAKVKVQGKQQSSKNKDLISCLLNFLNCFYILMHHIFPYKLKPISQLTYTCSKLTIATLEKGVKYVQTLQ